ncbi:MAG: DNA polymerase [Woeseia sp.]
MQVHDELVFEIDPDAADDLSSTITDLMCNAASLAVPLLVEVGQGLNWDEAH